MTGTQESTGSEQRTLMLNPLLLVGAGLTVVGAIVLLETSGFLRPGFTASWWPAGIALLGVLQLTLGDHRIAKVIGLCLALFGGALLFANLQPDVLQADDVLSYAAPAALVAIGGYLIHRALSVQRSPLGRPADEISLFCFWSGQERRIATRAFAGGHLTAVMGGFELDLRDADIAAGEEAVLDVLVVMGGGELLVPASWRVESHVTPIMGGVSVKTRSSIDGADKCLRLEGLVLMGGLEVRHS